MILQKPAWYAGTSPGALPQLITTNTRRIPRTYTALLFFLLLGAFISYFFLDAYIPTDYISFRSEPSIYDVYNETLGFEKIIAIGFEERTDKRDSVTLASTLTGFDIEWIEGVFAADVPKKAAPPKWNYEKLTPGSLGCWRAHMNAIQKVVREKIQSALIIEDDADWDVAIKSQMHQYAIGARALQNVSAVAPTHSPYGDEWDFFWLGSCQISALPHRQPIYVFENDHTVPPISKRRGKWQLKKIPPEAIANNTRMIFHAGHGMCTAAYAVTFESAKKILTQLSVHALPMPIDYGYGGMCRGQGMNPFVCIAPYPTLFGTHRAAGPESRDSDIAQLSSTWHDAYSFDVVYSAKLNLKAMARGDKAVAAQWPKEVANHEVMYDSRAPLEGELRYMELAKLPESRVKNVNFS